MTTLNRFVLTASLVAGLSASAFAQGSTYRQRHDINQRKYNQQARIAQGVRSGQMTPREASRVERQEGRINREEHAMRAADGGHLTAGDRHTLARQQNRESQRIYNQKHDAQTDYGVRPR